MNEIVRVFACKVKGSLYRYQAVLSSGEIVVIRQSARAYPLAFLYARAVTSGNKAGLARHFTFGKTPSSNYRDLLKKTFVVEHV